MDVYLISRFFTFLKVLLKGNFYSLFFFPGEEYIGWKPVWFTKQIDPQTGSSIHMFNNKYWECKKSGDWSACPDIYLWWMFSLAIECIPICAWHLVQAPFCERRTYIVQWSIVWALGLQEWVEMPAAFLSPQFSMIFKHCAIFNWLDTSDLGERRGLQDWNMKSFYSTI